MTTPSKKTNGLAGLIAKSKIAEQRITSASNLTDIETTPKELPIIPEPTSSIETTEELPEKKDVELVSQPKIHGKSQSIETLFSVFSKRREKEASVERVVVPKTQRDELKIIATALGLNLQDLVANILDNFLETNQVEIKKAKRKMIEGK